MPHAGPRVLIVDDERDICELLFRVLEKEGFVPSLAHDAETALEMIRLGIPELVISDVKMPEMDGIELLRRAKKLDPDLPVLMITAWGAIDGAVEAMKIGAFDYLAKPLDMKLLTEKVRLALKGKRKPADKRPPVPTDRNESIRALHEMMGPSDAVKRIVEDVRLVCLSNFSVLILGETGTGKELVARGIHAASRRAEASLVPIDCGAIPESLFESELFGHEKGAFTGAIASKPGKFEIAHRGTLFLDEIGNLPLGSQIKLLRAIQERSFYRVGGTHPVQVDVRLIAASNQDLRSPAVSGKFSRDLFYRVSEFAISIPPLRERARDIMHIAERVRADANKELGKQVRGFSGEAARALRENPWPGNVRQLRSVVRRAVLLAKDEVGPTHLVFDEDPIPEIDVPPDRRESAWKGLSLKEIVRQTTMDVEKNVITDVLRKTGGNKAKAARLLKIDYTTILAKIKLYDIRVDPETDAERL
ncbi:MAG: sigma-54 dependent transcriptional regulator [Thermodesulfobacteriota bacterium]